MILYKRRQKDLSSVYMEWGSEVLTDTDTDIEYMEWGSEDMTDTDDSEWEDPDEREKRYDYHGAQPRTTEFDRPVDEVLGATLGGKEENVNLRDILVPRLPPEQQIRQEEEVQTPPRREPRRNEGHQPRGPRAMTDVSVLAPGGLVDQRKDTAGRNRQNDEWSPVAALEDTVSHMQRDLEDLQTENRF